MKGRRCCARLKRRFAGLMALAASAVLSPAAAGAAASASAPAAVSAPVVATAARLGGAGERTRFVLDIGKPVAFNAYVVPGPFRVIVDMPEVDFRLPDGLGDRGLGLVSAYRYGSIGPGKSRIVMDASVPVLIDKAFLVPAENGQPARLVIDLVQTDAAGFAAAQKRERQARLLAKSGGEAVPEVPPAAGPGTGRAAPPAAGSGKVAAVPPPAAPRPNDTARKKGLRTIVIDAGHGGIDPGAISPDGLREKDVVLAFAKMLRDKLAATGRFEVVMTRDSDTFLTLPARVQVARDHEADLFIAIHADTVRGASVRGATVYTVSEKASDAEAEALASSENRSDILAGVDLTEENDDITGILIDLARRETKNHAISFAKHLVSGMQPVTALTKVPLRSAGFKVLKAPDVPSVLVELGYLSTKADVDRLTSAGWRDQVTDAMANAVTSYFSRASTAAGD